MGDERVGTTRERMLAFRQRLADVEAVAEATGLRDEEVEELYRIADRMKTWDGRSPMAMDGTDFFGALGRLPKLLAALASGADHG